MQVDRLRLLCPIMKAAANVNDYHAELTIPQSREVTRFLSRLGIPISFADLSVMPSVTINKLADYVVSCNAEEVGYLVEQMITKDESRARVETD